MVSNCVTSAPARAPTSSFCIHCVRNWICSRRSCRIWRDFTVYALDYPGHGYSDIPNAKYDADFFVRSVEGFLDALDLRAATLCGVSIGGAISLIIAARRNARVSRVLAVNPYEMPRVAGWRAVR
jgi:pimeloyl-ACP methyl ester carboxylesterase